MALAPVRNNNNSNNDDDDEKIITVGRSGKRVGTNKLVGTQETAESRMPPRRPVGIIINIVSDCNFGGKTRWRYDR